MTRKNARHSKKCACNEHIKVQTEFYSDFINKLQNPKTQNKLLSRANPCFFRYCGQCANGILKGNIKLSKKRLQQLIPEKKLLLKLVRPSVSLDSKKNFFLKEQKGGFLGVLAAIASSALSSIIGSQIAKLF